MGCGDSKLRLEEQQAVAHCRRRSEALARAIQRRYALADAHAAYAASLADFGASLFAFFAVMRSHPLPSLSPLLSLPANPKSASPAVAAAAALTPDPASECRHAQSHSGSHIHFHSPEDDADDHDENVSCDADSNPNGDGDGSGRGDPHLHFHEEDSGSHGGNQTNARSVSHLHFSPDDSNAHYMSSYGDRNVAGGGYPYNTYNGVEVVSNVYGVGRGHTVFNMNYARSQPPPSSVTYHQRPEVVETVVHYANSSQPPAYTYYTDPYEDQVSTAYNPYASYSNYDPEMGGYFASSFQSSPGYTEEGSRMISSPTETPPPPPSPPQLSTWDFLNPFNSYERHLAPCTPSRSSKEVREEEGIPDLEDEENEIVKEAFVEKKDTANSGKENTAKEDAKSSSDDDCYPELNLKSSDDCHKKSKLKFSYDDSLQTSKSNSSGDDFHQKLNSNSASVSTTTSSTVSEHEIELVDKNVVEEPTPQMAEQKHLATIPSKTYNDDPEVIRDIKVYFEKAGELASHASRMLEVGKMPYFRKNSVYRVSMSAICGFPSSLRGEFLHFEEEKVMDCGNLSSTLRKLYMWEKKLLEEVKAEESLRVTYDRKCEELKLLDRKGAEPDKIEATQRFIRKLSVKLSIAIRVVKTISNRINKLRDEELWPLVCALIQGLMHMWEGMIECHHIQSQAILQAKKIDSLVTAVKFSELHLNTIKHLEIEVLDWMADFSAWVDSQKCFIIGLNEWLKNGVTYVPEVTNDGTPAFSPGRLGAPPVFIICNNWAQVMERISEREVVAGMQAFATKLSCLWERHKFWQHQSVEPSEDMGGIELSMHRALEAQKRKLTLVANQNGVSLSGEVLDEDPSSDIGSFQLSLRQIFEAMETFTRNAANSYKDLHAHAEQVKLRLAEDAGKVTGGFVASSSSALQN